MRLGAVKRFAFLVGVVVVFLGALVLLDPVVAGDHNCGTALIPKRFVQSKNSRLCDRQIRRRRWLGAGILAVGAVAVILPGPRCLLTDD